MADRARPRYVSGKSKMLKRLLAHLEIACVLGSKMRCSAKATSEDGDLQNQRIGGMHFFSVWSTQQLEGKFWKAPKKVLDPVGGHIGLQYRVLKGSLG